MAWQYIPPLIADQATGYQRINRVINNIKWLYSLISHEHTHGGLHGEPAGATFMAMIQGNGASNPTLCSNSFNCAASPTREAAGVYKLVPTVAIEPGSCVVISIGQGASPDDNGRVNAYVAGNAIYLYVMHETVPPPGTSKYEPWDLTTADYVSVFTTSKET